MVDLKVREDDYSFQVVSDESARFYIRVVEPAANADTVVFSDFILGAGDNARAVEALALASEKGCAIDTAGKLVIQNIYPSQWQEISNDELLKRHDQILEVVNEYARQSGLTVTNAYLHPGGTKFDTVVLIAKDH